MSVNTLWINRLKVYFWFFLLKNEHKTKKVCTNRYVFKMNKSILKKENNGYFVTE